MKKYYFFTLFTLSNLLLFAYPKVVIETNYGNIEAILYEDTPKHSKNFIQLIKKGTYEGLLFHRVIKGFMIQGGDPTSKHSANTNEYLGTGELGYTIPSEFNPKYIHKRAALCAARQPDENNPKQASSASQFYIVQGRTYFKEAVINMRKKIQKECPHKHIPDYSQEQLTIYETLGGAPHLDMSYTIFGEIIKGMKIVDKIAQQSTNDYDRPIKNIPMHIKLIP